VVAAAAVAAAAAAVAAAAVAAAAAVVAAAAVIVAARWVSRWRDVAVVVRVLDWCMQQAERVK
jgi:hypothetical protein